MFEYSRHTEFSLCNSSLSYQDSHAQNQGWIKAFLGHTNKQNVTHLVKNRFQTLQVRVGQTAALPAPCN